MVELKTDSANGWACQFDEVPTSAPPLCTVFASRQVDALHMMQDKIVCNGNQDAQVWDLRMQEKRQSFTASDSIRFLQYDNNKIVMYVFYVVIMAVVTILIIGQPFVMLYSTPYFYWLAVS